MHLLAQYTPVYIQRQKEKTQITCYNKKEANLQGTNAKTYYLLSLARDALTVAGAATIMLLLLIEV